MQPASRAELLTRDYPAAVTDFYGTPSNGLTVYRTGEPWRGLSPAESGGYPCHRELIPVGNHPLMSWWCDEIVPTIAACLDERKLIFNTLLPLGVKNQGDPIPVAPLVIVIGCDPGSVTFAEAKSALDHIKAAILVDRFGFKTIDIALRDWTTQKTATHANQQAIPAGVFVNPLTFPDSEVYLPFSNVLSPPISTVNNPNHQGSACVYLQRKNDDGSTEYMLVTASHVVRPLTEPGYQNVPYTRDSRDPPILVTSLGDEGFADAKAAVTARINIWQQYLNTNPQRIKTLEERLANAPSNDEPLANAIKEQIEVQHPREEKDIKSRIDRLAQFSRDFVDVSKAEERVIGEVAHADAIGPSPHRIGRGPSPGYTLDWAVVKLYPEFCSDPHFLGNMVFIGDYLKVTNFSEKVKCHHDKKPCHCLGYPLGGLFPITSIAPEASLQSSPKKPLDGVGNGLSVMKRGLTGTTAGELNNVNTFVRYYSDDMKDGTRKLEFEGFELTVLGRDGSFSKKGDSGAPVFDREARLVGLLTGGSGLNDKMDLSYVTPFYLIWHRLRELFPGWTLCPPAYI